MSAPTQSPRPFRRTAGFTLIEVGMAALMLVVAFIGLIEAVTLSARMMDQARRQTLAAQVLNHEIEKLRLQSWTTINALPTGATAEGAAYASGTAYVVGDTVTSSSVWYRCIQAGTGQTPSSSPSYWVVDTPPYSGVMTASGVALGATYTISRSVADVVSGSLREVTFTVTWVVTTSRLKADGTRLTFSYSRVNVAYFGKYGLNLSYQRS